MGSEITMSQNPNLLLKLLEALNKIAGCSNESVDALSSDRLDYLCAGECYNPSNERHVLNDRKLSKLLLNHMQVNP